MFRWLYGVPSDNTIAKMWAEEQDDKTKKEQEKLAREILGDFNDSWASWEAYPVSVPTEDCNHCGKADCSHCGIGTK
jgi:hypothetical protein